MMEMLKGSPETKLTRYMALLCCLVACAIGIAVLFQAKPDMSGASMLCGVFLGAAFGGNIMHKPSVPPQREQ